MLASRHLPGRSGLMCGRPSAGGWAASLPLVAAMAMVMQLAGCGSRPADSPVAVRAPAEAAQVAELPQRAFYTPGEIMEFALAFRGVTVGSAVLAVGEPGTEQGRPVVIVRSELSSAGFLKLIKKVRDDVTTRIDLNTGAPVKNKGDLTFGDKHLVIESFFLGRRVLVDYIRNGKTRLKKLFVMPRGQYAHDAHSFLGVLRAWEPRVGDTAWFYALSGRRMWKSDLRFVGPETIRTSMGLYPALRFDGVATRLTTRLAVDTKRPPRTYTVWLSDDANRIPLRVNGHTEHGDVAIEMTRYYRPDRFVSSN